MKRYKRIYVLAAILIFAAVLSTSIVCNFTGTNGSKADSDMEIIDEEKSEESHGKEDTDEADKKETEVSEDFKYSMHFGIGGNLYPDIEQGEEAIRRITKDFDKLGMIWLRHPGRGIAWYEVQPSRNTWDFAKYDAVINNNNHPWIIPIYGMVGNVYPFEGNFSREYLESLGQKEDIMQYIIDHELDMGDEQQRADAEVYVKTFVNRYKDRIKYWEIGGNEGIGSQHRFDIVKNTYLWIKEVQPEAAVLITAVGGDDDNQFYNGIEAFNDLLAQGISDYFDIGHFHYYGRFEKDFESRLEERFDEYKGVMEKYGVSKPIWVTETSTSSYENTVLSEPGSERIQARHVVIRFVVFSSKGAEKVIWYNYGQLTEDDKFYGCNLVDNGDDPKPAYYTFKILVEKLGYYKKVDILQRDSIRLYRFIDEKDRPVFVAWADSTLNIDLSEYFKDDEVKVTHIIEDENIIPVVESVSTDRVSISPSPVFIEYK